jgi:predicted  nucleic acid-binding Zn-ribbon protein
MERLAEGQEELRGELGVLVERLDSLDQKLRALTKDHSAARGELERSQTQLVETFASTRERRERVLGYLAGAAVLLSGAALAISLLM